jgi:uncharacterized protein (TIGR02246 family)
MYARFFPQRNQKFEGILAPCQNAPHRNPVAESGATKKEPSAMKIFAAVVFSLYLAAAVPLAAQTKLDEDAVRNLPQAFCAAWAKHDGHELAKIMADDVDFVTVGGFWLQGRENFEKYHTRLLGKRFHESTNTLQKTEVRFLRPDLAVIHWSWKIEGDKDTDGTPRAARAGIMTMVAEKKKAGWLVVVAQNTNALPVRTPEAEGIQSPITVSADTKP